MIDEKVDPIGRAAVLDLLSNEIIRSVDYRSSMDSTNSEAMKQLQGNQIPPDTLPRLFLTDSQSAGRGRRGRHWQSDEGTLTFSLALARETASDAHPSVSGGLNRLPLAVGVGISRYLEFQFAPLKVRLKWPNDVHVAGGKVAGILIETGSNCPNRLVIGVGMNIGTVPDLSKDPSSQKPTGLSDVLGRNLERYAVLSGLVTEILEAVRDGDSEGDETLRDFRARCLLTGRQISFHIAGDEQTGQCIGISDNGLLRIAGPQGELLLSSGEVNLLRPSRS
ncbi:biotin--[acetyl-CoA-carboxylase] ligase [Rubripirellula sp.]|nr:biotin--[acetyl-CoA-carboxylase] ligase [Rubripirellula sp.]MDB4338824.1 biotin--[acetyl-CoA-carboxylase] ligase [Rubripirellula sp.]